MAGALGGLLLDSGDTLLRPAAGAWWPGPAFAQIVGARGAGVALDDTAALDRALEKGMAYLDARGHLPVCDEEAEVRLFEGYYGVVLRELGCESPEPAMTRELAIALVGGEIVEPFADTRAALARWRERGLRLALVSNAWPSLESHLVRLGLRELFDAVVISARLGVWKPADDIYLHAARELDLPPSRLLFVDDAEEHVARARQLGFGGLVIDRAGRGGDVHDLAGVERAVARLGGMLP